MLVFAYLIVYTLADYRPEESDLLTSESNQNALYGDLSEQFRSYLHRDRRSPGKKGKKGKHKGSTVYIIHHYSSPYYHYSPHDYYHHK